MAKKRTFDTAILNDIKSVAGDSFADNIKMIPVDQLHENKDNFYDLSDLDTLIEDIDRQGLKTPLYVVPDENGYTIISGHRRKAAVQELISSGKYGTDKLPCYIGSKKSETETMLDLIMLNATSRVITDAETMKQCEKLEEVFKQLEADGKKVQGRMRDKIASALNVSPAQVGKVENIRHNAIDEVKAAVDEGKMSISTANEVAKLDAEEQKDLIEKKKPEKITHKEAKRSVVEAVKNKKVAAVPKQKIDENEFYETEPYDDRSDDNTIFTQSATEDPHPQLAKADIEKTTAAAELWEKPPEYFNNIIDSGMCNSIISGYVLLTLERLDIEMSGEKERNLKRITNSVLDSYSAETARIYYLQH